MVGAKVCYSTREPVPEVDTLMASRNNSARDAWILMGTCDIKIRPLFDGTLTITNADASIDKVVSLPEAITKLTLENQPLARGADFSGATKMVQLVLRGISTKLFDKVSFPSSLTELCIEDSTITSIDTLKIPKTVTILNLKANQIKSIKRATLPADLDALMLMNNKLSAVDFVIPSKLTTLNLDLNPIPAFEKTALPPLLESFNLQDNPLTDLELRQTDYELLAKRVVKIGAASGELKCSDPTAVIRTIEGIGLNPESSKVCVISDERFDAKYRPGSSSAETAGSLTNGEASRAGVESISDILDKPTTKPTTTTTEIPPVRDPEAVSSSSDGSNTNNTLMIAMVVVTGALLLLAGATLLYRRIVKATTKKRSQNRTSAKAFDHHAAAAMATDDGASSYDDDTRATASQSRHSVNEDIRFDKSLAKFRIERKEIQVGEPIAHGGFGMIYRGYYDGRDVAIKQMLPDTWRDDAMRASFMDEIRMCASLEHARVVEFIGISWSSLRDLAVVIEFMAGGDLFTLLHAQRERSPAPSPLDWSQPWTPSQIKSKTSIALDVAEAVVYLHSYNSPILHRDLKAKNVLLDLEGNAKLSDFGISREMSVDETMTSEVGTIAWIAPEVLRGERYSEKADIYSLGVLLVELDRCQHPYADVRLHGWTGLVSDNNAQIAVLVSTGKIRPQVATDCPEVVASLVTRCLQFDPADRPTAMEAFYEFRQLNKKWRDGWLV